MPLTQAEGGDQAIYRLPHRMAPPAKRPKIAGCGDGECRSARVEHLGLEEFLLRLPELNIVSDALQDLTEDQICQTETLAAGLFVQPIGLRVLQAAEVLDPDRRVDDDHVALFRDASLTRVREIPFPRDLAPQAADSCLRTGLNQQAPASTVARFVRAPLVRMA